MTNKDPSVTTSGESEDVRCPFCEGIETERIHPRGPSLCQSIHFCTVCQEQFRQFD